MSNKPVFASQRSGKPLEKPVRSPCISACNLDDRDICNGCYRTGSEISQWGRMTNDQRLEVIRNCQERAAKSNPFL
jgi:predicted Fe-S protein YdhL (DUF1289 family)